MIKVIELRHISLHCRDILADQGDCLIQLRLPTPSNKDVGSFFHERLGRSQADSAVASGDYSYFAI
jgi:hypothetical protein